MRKIAQLLMLLTLSGSALAQPDLPPDVRAFITQRQACDHWRGEEPYDFTRKREIELGLCATCRGTDARLQQLQRKYMNNPAVGSALAEFEFPLGEMSAEVCQPHRKKMKSK